ncbi:MAG: hypothetical protein LBD92_01910 [Oscillospiraceae bacterium]|nr:hypothetical protein [Oscillospiraceae bacterium]
MAQAAAADYAATYSSQVRATAGMAAGAEQYARPGTRTAPVPERVRTGAPERASQRETRAYGVSLFSAVGFIIIAALMTLVVLAYVSMNTVSKSTVDLKMELNALADEERRLRIAYENVFDMAQIETYAVNALGMQPASEGQIGTISSAAAADKAVIIRDAAPEKGNLIDDMTEFIVSLLEYFR